MTTERRQRQDRLALVLARRRPPPSRAARRARQLDGALEVLARLLGVADAAEHAAEDPVRAAGGARLAEPLGQAQRLLGRVDGEHVVAGVEVQPGRLLVEAHQLEPRRAVLQQVDALLVVLDGRLALALVRERGADLAVQVRHPLEVLLDAVPVEALEPDRDRLVHAAEAQRHVAELLADAHAVGAPVLRADRARVAVVRGRFAVGEQVAAASPACSRNSIARRCMLSSSSIGRPSFAPQGGRAAVVLGEQRHHLVGAVAGALLDERRRPRSASAPARPWAASRRPRRGSARA